ncbi:potassium channel family protein [Planctomicrobium piriforme]|uniref:Ion channel n=1 Tax=Planctomicrobium piriforme TaxID=1576369 RepID=A0A1I3FGN8_9PLAN|nr:potassium channel family protein [Planctomicrobium piriforme]SFI10375.1 Ion channel [Planctomicrobium piriforme]
MTELDSQVEPEPSMSSAARYSAALFLAAMLALLCISPLLEHLAHGNVVESLLLTAVLLSAIPALGGDHRTIAIACLLAIPTVAGKWMHQFLPAIIPNSFYLVTAIAFAMLIIAHHLRFILWAPVVDAQVLCAGVSTFLMMGLLWTFAYLLLESVAPDSFTIQMGPGDISNLKGFPALYYSFTTLTGVSFNEIVPVSNAARMLTLTEAMASLFYFAMLISRLVALHAAHAETRR